MKFNWSLLLLITATSHELGVSPWHHLLLPKDSVETSKTNSCYLPSQKWFGQWNGQLNSHMGKVQLHSKERFTDLFPANSPNFCERTPRCPQANKKISPPCLGSAPAHRRYNTCTVNMTSSKILFGSIKTVTILMFGNVMNCECALTG